MIAITLGFSIYLLLVFPKISDALQCYNCTDIADVDECLTVTECHAGQSCHIEVKSTGQRSTLGCTDNQLCGVSASGAGNLIGREISGRQTPDYCHECCSKEKCNKNLCAHLKPGACIDDVKVDCAFLNSFFNICKDIQRAKLICAKFCSLCSLEDGKWASWSTWSTCDVTCENGTQTRTRQCFDPPPANGGLDCAGTRTDIKTCLKQLCVDGGWTDWGQWSTCSVTCEDGMKSRSRTCTYPSPSLNGKYCEGDSLEVVSCRKIRCSPNILFKAKGLTNRKSTGSTIFGSILVNEGNAYNTSTGIFTAPVNGTYSFSIQMCAAPGKEVYSAIMIDGTTQATLYVYDRYVYSCDSTDTVAVLHEHSKVFVKCTLHCENTVYQDDFHMNSFSGYLVH